MNRPKALFVLDQQAYDMVYAPSAAAEIINRVQLLAPPMTAKAARDNPDLIGDAELIFSGWGCPNMDRRFLDQVPNLKAVFYAAGAINSWATSQVWDRNIAVTTANDANAIPVAEFTVATTLFSLKNGWKLSRNDGRSHGFSIRTDIIGNYKSTVGLVGMGTIARAAVKMLVPFNLNLLACDPFLTTSGATALGVTKGSLREVFANSDVVSLHLPDLPATRGLITGELISTMKTGATLINTARGSVIRESEMVQMLAARPDLQAVLDVTEEEPLPLSSPLRSLSNVVLTPHIAGSQGRECQRLGQYMVEELDRYLAGEPMRWQVRPKQLEHTVHFLNTKDAAVKDEAPALHPA